jgi:hypothetical protein
MLVLGHTPVENLYKINELGLIVGWIAERIIFSLAVVYICAMDLDCFLFLFLLLKNEIKSRQPNKIERKKEWMNCKKR